MNTISGLVHSWDRARHRGIAELDDHSTVRIFANNLAVTRRRPEWQGQFEMRAGDRFECVRDDAGNITDVLRVW
ncbi:hypothetical protein [Bradyrhizobium glycinis]|uniref:hypothetical protein n=1 Tax=Bradyrhizobium glycinis TaxID=2751812 RepID=UPI0018D8CDCF|nr:hypothetical protein [Bradyrhizobium glycinis]MBH5371476.1 hypothetical protein [Bradyrhizobium glycinis]